ncbi:MAG: S26 family signal peptidase [Epsilonproteobacteria bacterium]|nr:S26 family signal peptidase [Campylobacterota bacterium]
MIEGDSLYPLRKHGEKILCIKVFAYLPIRVGDIVLVDKQGYPKMVKRVKYINTNGYFVQGTTPDSIDSRDFGYLTKHEITYKQILKAF